MTLACPDSTQAKSHTTPPPQNAQRSHLGEVVLGLLAEHDLSLNKLAQRVGWNRGHLSRVFSGPLEQRRAPSSGLIDSLTAELGAGEAIRAAVRADGHLPTVVAPASRPAQIPPPSAALVGHPLANVGRHTLALDGPPGSGTTAWARWWAHQIGEHYPDGHLVAELDTATPHQVLGTWLADLGVDTSRIPTSWTERARLWQGLTRSRRLVVLLDGVTCDDQVTELRPVGSGSALITTSRTRLPQTIAATGAAHVTLGPLPAPEARALLSEQLAPHPVTHDGPLLDAIAHACGRLPLALHEAAARLATSASPAAVLSDLQNDPLAVLPTLRAHLAEHRDTLPTAHARIARLLAHHGLAATAAEVAALRPTTEPDARRLCDELVANHALTTTHDGRYRMPTLLAHALRAEPSAHTDLAAAQRRWCAWWLSHARRAAALLDPNTGADGWHQWQPPTGLTHTDLSTPDQARAWCATHLDELPTVIGRAAETGLDAPAWWYLQALRPHLVAFPRPELARHAIRAARDAGRKQTDQRLDQLDRELAATGEA